MYCYRKIQDDLYWIGANDRRLAMFEGVYSVPAGVSYNSYLLLDEKTVLFDTVDKAVSKTFFENLAAVLGDRKLDYVIVHHMEPDHSATLAEVLLRYPDVKIICTPAAKKMMGQFFDFDVDSHYVEAAEGTVFSTGRHNFCFVKAPMVHWPEVMVSFDTTDGILFSADAFGTFGALNGALFADEVNFDRDYLDEARRYYTNIVGKYGTQVTALLKKASMLDIKMICPLHGFVWRKDIEYYINKYLHWGSYTPEEKGVMIAYASIYGNTENAAEILAVKLRGLGRIGMQRSHITLYGKITFQLARFAAISFLYRPHGCLHNRTGRKRHQCRGVHIGDTVSQCAERSAGGVIIGHSADTGHTVPDPCAQPAHIVIAPHRYGIGFNDFASAPDLQYNRLPAAFPQDLLHVFGGADLFSIHTNDQVTLLQAAFSGGGRNRAVIFQLGRGNNQHTVSKKFNAYRLTERYQGLFTFLCPDRYAAETDAQQGGQQNALSASEFSFAYCMHRITPFFTFVVGDRFNLCSFFIFNGVKYRIIRQISGILTDLYTKRHCRGNLCSVLFEIFCFTAYRRD